ncbi:F-box domain-containing protein [Balamuthia mandrillaris]
MKRKHEPPEQTNKMNNRTADRHHQRGDEEEEEAEEEEGCCLSDEQQPRKKKIQPLESEADDHPIMKLLSDELLFLIFCHLPPKAVIWDVGLVCKRWRAIAEDNTMWKVICQHHWKYFHWEGKPSGIIYDEEVQGFHPDLRSIDNFKTLFQELLTGKRGYELQVLNSLSGREMSAYNGKATWDPAQKAFHVEYISAKGTHSSEYLQHCESRMRRIPDDLYGDDVFQIKSPDPNVVFQIGDEVEIQWRMKPISPFGWWRGFVKSIDSESILVDFPQFTESNVWRTVTVARDGTERPNGQTRGFIGGIRKVTPHESLLWKQLFSPLF